MCWKSRITHLKIKLPYNVLLGDTTNAKNVSAKNSAVARLDLLGGRNHERRRRELLGGSGGMHPWKILKYGVSEIAF